MREETSTILTGIGILVLMHTLFFLDRGLEYYTKYSEATRYASSVVGNRDNTLQPSELPEFNRLVTGNPYRTPDLFDLRHFLEDK